MPRPLDFEAEMNYGKAKNRFWYDVPDYDEKGFKITQAELEKNAWLSTTDCKETER